MDVSTRSFREQSPAITDAPRDLQRLVRRCLQKDPEEREPKRIVEDLASGVSFYR